MRILQVNVTFHHYLSSRRGFGWLGGGEEWKEPFLHTIHLNCDVYLNKTTERQ